MYNVQCVMFYRGEDATKVELEKPNRCCIELFDGTATKTVGSRWWTVCMEELQAINTNKYKQIQIQIQIKYK